MKGRAQQDKLPGSV